MSISAENDITILSLEETVIKWRKSRKRGRHEVIVDYLYSVDTIPSMFVYTLLPPIWTIALSSYSHSGNSIRLPGAYAPSTKKSYFEMSKNFNKKFYMYIFIIYVRSSSFTKNQYFLWSI
jgi:hypothetical protein